MEDLGGRHGRQGREGYRGVAQVRVAVLGTRFCKHGQAGLSWVVREQSAQGRRWAPEALR